MVLFLVSLRAAPPFSAGQRLGWGLLIGGLAAVLAGLGCARLERPPRGYCPYPAGLALSMALAAVSLALLCFRGDPADALLGSGLGFLAVAMVFRTMQAVEAEAALALEAGGALAATLAAGCVLAVHHFDSREARGWWAGLLAIAAFWLLGRLLAYIATEQRLASRYPGLLAMIAAVAAGALALILGALLGGRLEPPQQLLALLASGVVTGALVAWLATSVATGGTALPRALGIPALGMLLVVFLVVLTFKLLDGFGVAVALVAAWAIAGAVLGAEGPVSRVPVLTLMLGANFLLVRLFVGPTGSALENADITPHYALVGIVLGIMLPFVACSFRLKQGLGRAILIGAFTVLSPLVLLLLWGAPAALGLLLGLVGAQALSVLLAPVGEISAEAAVWHAPISLMAIGMSLLTVQVVPALASLYEVSRQGKVYVAAAVAVVAVLWAIGLGLARLRQRGQEG